MRAASRSGSRPTLPPPPKPSCRFTPRAPGAGAAISGYTPGSRSSLRAKTYTVYEVIGWRLRWEGSALTIRSRVPDERWFGSAPVLLADKRGADADALIGRIDQAARAYPYAAEYTMWPGPNSNTFTAWIGRAAPELGMDLPPTAIGKDYLGDRLVAAAPSGSGIQFSLFGLLGIIASGVEGFEMNVLGLTFGFDPFSPAIKLPFIGRIGAAR